MADDAPTVSMSEEVAIELIEKMSYGPRDVLVLRCNAANAKAVDQFGRALWDRMSPTNRPAAIVTIPEDFDLENLTEEQARKILGKEG